MSGTSETSTLTIASLAVASSLILLTVSKQIGLEIMFWPGQIIALAGISYREVYVHQGIHFPRRSREEQIMTLIGISRRRGWNRAASISRSFLFRVFQIIPVGLWSFVIYPTEADPLHIILLSVYVITLLTVSESVHYSLA